MSLSINAAVGWWRDLQPDADRGRPGDRAALARLRRCAAVAEAMQDQATIALFRRCGGTGPRDLPDAGLAAAVLAHVRSDDAVNVSIARRVGPEDTDKPETALLKPLRFRRLMEATTPDERLTSFRRLVALAGGTLNVADLTGALLAWSDSRKTDWVYAYWNAGHAATASELRETKP